MKLSWLPSSLLFSGLMFGGSLVWGAAINCQPEGTDTSVEYGDTVSCEFEQDGDLDVFRFDGSAGDQPLIQVAAQDFFTPVYVYLYDAQGGLLQYGSDWNTTRITGYDLPKDGRYTIIAGSDNSHSYTLEQRCPISLKGKPLTVAAARAHRALARPV